jgi:hypothetical protein
MAADVEEKLAELDPKNTVVLVQLLENSIYQCKLENGDRVLPKKGHDRTYHAKGELCVVNRDTLRELFSAIQPIFKVTRGFQCIFLTPLPRYLWTRCCSDPPYIKNSEDPGYAAGMGKSLHELNRSLKNMIFTRKLKDISLLNSLEALGIVSTADANATDDDEGRVIAKWGADPVHPTSAAYRELAAKVASKASALLTVKTDEEKPYGERKRKQELRDPWIAGSQSIAKWLDNRSSTHGGRGGQRGVKPSPRPFGACGRWHRDRKRK